MRFGSAGTGDRRHLSCEPVQLRDAADRHRGDGSSIRSLMAIQDNEENDNR